MDEKIDYVISKLNKKTFINKWINGLYKKRPILIYGNPGTGKSTLAKYIVKDFTTIVINIDIYKTNQNLSKYLEMTLYKKSIIMMFHQNEKTYKAVIFDDLDFIQKNDKKMFLSIIDFSKQKNLNHPIIYISNTIKHKNIISLYDKSFPINVSLKKKDLIYLIDKYINTKKNIDYDELIQKSNRNLHSIKVNIEFHAENTNQIKIVDKDSTDYNILTNDIYDHNIKELYRICEGEYITNSLNLLENIYNLVLTNKKLSYKKKIKIINKIYYLHCIGDNYLTYIYNNNNWELIKYIITNILIYPLHIFKINKINLNKEIKNNHYISKSIIHTYNTRLLKENNLNYIILSKLYYFLSKKEYCNMNRLINNYHITINIMNKFIKYFEIFNLKKNDLKTKHILILKNDNETKLL